MSEFSFNSDAVTSVLSQLEELARQLSEISNETKNVEGNLNEEVISFRQVVSAIRNSSEQISQDSRKMTLLKTGLENISLQYQNTEKSLIAMTERSAENLVNRNRRIRQLINGIEAVINSFLISTGLLPGGSNNNTSEYAGEPVDMCMGSYVNSITELSLYGEPDLTFVRNYNSRFPQNGTMGFGWSHNFETRLEIGDEELILYDGDGRQERFKSGTDGIFVSVFGGYENIVRKEDGFCLYGKDDKEIRFDPDGKMAAYSGGNGSFVRCCYEGNRLIRVEAGKTRALFFVYDQAGLLSTVRDSIGRTVNFTYTDGLLTSAVSADGSEEKYEYETAMRLTALINAEGVRILENKYDDEFRVVHQQFPDGTEMKYEYEENALRFTDRNGSVATYYHDDRYRHIRTVFEYGEESYSYNDKNERILFTEPDGAQWQREFNDAGQVISLTDPMGHVTRYERDRDGRITCTRSPDGSVKEQVYDDAGHVIEISDGIGGIQRMQYSDGRLTAITDPDGAVQHLKYDEEGRIKTIIDGNGSARHLEYDGAGRITRYIDRRGNATEMQYDKMDRVTLIRDALGGERLFEYTLTGRLAGEKDPAGNMERWTYDSMGQMCSYTDKSGGITKYQYDNMGNPTHIQFPDGSCVERHYDRANRLESERWNNDEPELFEYDPCGRLICERRGPEEKKYSYDAAGRLISQTDWDGGKIRAERDKMGNVVRRSMSDGSFVRFVYDASGRCICESHSSGKEVCYNYSAAGKLISREDGSGNGAEYQYDAEGNLREVKFSDGNYFRYRYDEESNLLERISGSGYAEYYSYDALGRRIEIRDSDGRSKQLTYNSGGQISETVDVSGNHAFYNYSPSGKLLSVRDEAGGITRYRYDAMGRLNALLKGEEDDETAEMVLAEPARYQSPDNNNWHLTSWEHDSSGRIREIRNARGESEHFYWDGFGRLSTHVDLNGNRLDYRYSAGGLLSEILYGGKVRTRFSYDDMGHVRTMEDSNGSSSFRFDSEGDLVRAKDCFDHTTDYCKDSNGLLRSMKTENAVYNYEYDSKGRLTAQELNGAKVTYSYNKEGRMSSRTMQNGTSEHYEYTPAGKIARLKHMDSSGLFYLCTYRYDKFGNLSEKCEEFRNGKKRTLQYDYDELQRLISRKENGVTNKTWSYDVYGNCVRTNENGLLTEFRYNVLNQLTEKLENGHVTSTYEYDSGGNMIRETGNGAARSYYYDCENHLAGYEDSDGSRVEYLWDGMGHRLGKRSNGVRTLYGLDFSRTHHNILTVEEENQRRNLLWDGGLVTMQTEQDHRWFFRDELASIRGEADDEGNIRRNWRYDEFGQAAESGDGVPEFGFAGLQYDAESRSYFAQQRSYAPHLGRFLSKDRERYIYTTIPESVNLYTYCRNNPLIYVDPDGTDCYIFYLPEWKNEAMADRRALAEKYGYGEEHVHMIPINNNADFTNGWNGMGTVNGQQVDIDTVVIDSHASPNGLGYNASNDHFGAQNIRALDNKDVRELVLYGCNAGHMDYVNTNPASEFAGRVNGAQVLASDGTVYSNPNSNEAQSFDSRADDHFRNLLRNGNRDNYGWIEYQVVNGKLQTRRVNDKTMRITEMTDYLRQRRGTLCSR